ncbi:MAG: hypothetical protein JWQ71_3179, partial [Pedosphaera sp.]|nr:hypothetical protein [Pedosphaera sp.]
TSCFVFLLMSLCMSGNTDFWRNDRSTQTCHLTPGNILFGANRVSKTSHFLIVFLPGPVTLF